MTEADVWLWAALAGEAPPPPRASAFAQQAAQSRHVVHGAYLAGLVVATAARLAAQLPPRGAAIVNVSVQFRAPVPVGATLCVVATVAGWDAAAGFYHLEIGAIRADGAPVLTGSADLRPNPTLFVAA